MSTLSLKDLPLNEEMDSDDLAAIEGGVEVNLSRGSVGSPGPSPHPTAFVTPASFPGATTAATTAPTLMMGPDLWE